VPCAACSDLSVPAHTLTSRRARSAATARATARAWGLLRSFYSVVGRGSALRYAYGGSDGGPQRLADSPHLMRSDPQSRQVEPDGIIRNQFETRA
jgi:hypothetical protein